MFSASESSVSDLEIANKLAYEKVQSIICIPSMSSGHPKGTTWICCEFFHLYDPFMILTMHLAIGTHGQIGTSSQVCEVHYQDIPITISYPRSLDCEVNCILHGRNVAEMFCATKHANAIWYGQQSE